MVGEKQCRNSFSKNTKLSNHYKNVTAFSKVERHYYGLKMGISFNKVQRFYLVIDTIVTFAAYLTFVHAGADFLSRIPAFTDERKTSNAPLCVFRVAGFACVTVRIKHPQRERLPLLGAKYYINDTFIIYIYLLVKKISKTHYIFTLKYHTLLYVAIKLR